MCSHDLLWCLTALSEPILAQYERNDGMHAGSQEAQEQLGLLQEMFPTMDADLVRDVVDNVQGNSEKACRQLLLIQVTTSVHLHHALLHL